MGFHLVENVYRLPFCTTNSLEQAVLVALAFRANDKTGLCYPSQVKLSDMTHFARSSIASALNKLREKGLIDWDTGGFRGKRGKKGALRASTYTLHLDAPQPPDASNHVRQADTAVSGNETPPCPAGGHRHVRQMDTAVSGNWTPTEKVNNKNNRSEPINRTPGTDRKSGGVKKICEGVSVEGMFSIPQADDNRCDEINQQMGLNVPAKDARRQKEREDEACKLGEIATRVCGITQKNAHAWAHNAATFKNLILLFPKLDDAREIINTFDSENKQGKNQELYNPAGALMARMKKGLEVNQSTADIAQALSRKEADFEERVRERDKRKQEQSLALQKQFGLA